MDIKSLRQHEKRILIGLVDFFYESGYTNDALMDPDTGGIYENKLAHRLGYEIKNNLAPPEVMLACQTLAAQGYVRRNKRDPGNQLMAVWPTRSGLDRVEYLRAKPLRKAVYVVRNNSGTILVSVVTTLIITILTLVVSALFGLFGLTI